VATGETHSVEEFAERAFAEVGLNWREYVRSDAKFYRPAEVNLLIGKAEKAERTLGWEPTVDFPALVRMMIRGDLERENSQGPFSSLGSIVAPEPGDTERFRKDRMRTVQGEKV